jgi:thiamine biosynthesis lipoprotein
VDRPDQRHRPRATALEAEALAKAALLSGPHDARKWLKKHGGLLITDDGDVHFV